MLIPCIRDDLPLTTNIVRHHDLDDNKGTRRCQTEDKVWLYIKA